MPDKRPVDELSIEELERVLAIKRREARQRQMQRMERAGRVISTPPNSIPPAEAAPQPISQAPHNVRSDAAGLPAQTIDAKAKPVPQRKAVPQFEDAIDLPSSKKRKAEGKAIWRKFVDRSLLLVEVAAVIALVVLGLSLFDGIEMLQTETASIQATAEAERVALIPTIEPTPTLRLVDVVLPSGHTPPVNGSSSFNFDEIPVGLQSQVASEIYLPLDVSRPQPTDETPLRIIIPDINVDHTIVQGVDWDALKNGVGQVLNGATPADDDRNVVLAAHNDIFGEIFREIEYLEPGMEFQIQTRSQWYTYRVREKQFVTPDAVHVMQDQGSAMATLISCWPYQVNDRRVVIHADRIDV